MSNQKKRNIRRMSFRKLLLAGKALKHFPSVAPRKTDHVTMRLGDIDYVLNTETKTWTANVEKKESTENVEKLKRKIQDLQEENNLLKFKNEIMLNIMTSQGLDIVHFQERLKNIKVK